MNLWLVLDRCKPRRTVQVHLTPKKNTRELQFDSHNYVFSLKNEILRFYQAMAGCMQTLGYKDITQSLPYKENSLLLTYAPSFIRLCILPNRPSHTSQQT